MNNLVKIGIAGGLAFGLYKLYEMNRVSEKVVTSLSNSRIHKVDLRGLVLRTEINIDNPTKSSVKITKPVITLTTNEKYITSSHPEDKVITIKPLATSQIDTIEVVIPWTIMISYIIGLTSKLPDIIAAFKAKDITAFGTALSIPLEMKYSLYANGIYYESEPEKLI